MSTKTTEGEFRQYVAHCKHWMKELGLTNYMYLFSLEDSNHDGAVQVNGDKGVQVILAREREGFYSIPQIARHEMLEVLVDPLAEGLYEMFSEEYVQGRRHDIIHRLEKILPIPTDAEVGFVSKKKKKDKKEKEMPCGGKKKKPKGK